MRSHRHDRRAAPSPIGQRRGFMLARAALISTAAAALLDAWLFFGRTPPEAVVLDVFVTMIWMLIVAALLRSHLSRDATAHEPARQPARQNGGAPRGSSPAHSRVVARSRRASGVRRRRPESS